MKAVTTARRDENEVRRLEVMCTSLSNDGPVAHTAESPVRQPRNESPGVVCERVRRTTTCAPTVSSRPKGLQEIRPRLRPSQVTPPPETPAQHDFLSRFNAGRPTF